MNPPSPPRKSALPPLLQGRRRGPSHAAWDVVSIVLGCVIVAVSFRLFTNPNGIVAGGVVGLSTILQGALHWEPAVVQWAINVPLLVLGFLVLGKAEGMRSLVGSFALPLAILLSRNLPAETHNPLLAAVFGGLCYGGGLGLVLSGKGSVGGYSLLGRVAARRFHVKAPSVMFVLDAFTILGGVWQFGPDRAMYGLVAAYLMRKAVERVLLGFSQSFMALVISERQAEIRHKVLVDMDRGLTVLPGEGGYSGDPRPVLMVVLAQSELPRLRALVQDCDPHAFVVVTEAAEVLGRGFHAE